MTSNKPEHIDRSDYLDTLLTEQQNADTTRRVTRGLEEVFEVAELPLIVTHGTFYRYRRELKDVARIDIANKWSREDIKSRKLVSLSELFKKEPMRKEGNGLFLLLLTFKAL